MLHLVQAYDSEETYSITTNLTIVNAFINRPFLGPWDINHTINYSMRNMYALRSKLPRKTLSRSPQCKLTARKGAHIRRSSE